MKTKLFIKIFTSIIIIISAIIFIMPSSVYIIDLLQSFTFHAMLGYGVIGLLFLLYKRSWLTIPWFGASLLLLLFLHPYLEKESEQEVTIKSVPFKVAHFNVLCTNKKYEKTIRKAVASQADLLSFQEVDTAWAKHLEEGLRQLFPFYHIVADDHSSHGLAVFSKYPLENVQVFYWSEVPNIAGDVIVSDSAVHFLASHTLSPRNKQRYRLRNQHIRQIANYLQSLEGPVLAIGDYNAVPWNHHIVSMKEKANMYDSRKDIIPTYPSVLRSGGIPIDYIFHSKDFQCINFQAIPTDGSDHRGVLGVYQLKKDNI